MRKGGVREEGKKGEKKKRKGKGRKEGKRKKEANIRIGYYSWADVCNSSHRKRKSACNLLPITYSIPLTALS